MMNENEDSVGDEMTLNFYVNTSMSELFDIVWNSSTDVC